MSTSIAETASPQTQEPRLRIPSVDVKRRIGDYDEVITRRRAGVYGIVEDNESGNPEQSAQIIEHFLENSFDPQNPLESFEQGFRSAYEETGGQDDLNTGFVKLFQTPDGRSAAAYGRTGNVRLLRENENGLTEIAGSEGGYEQFDVIELLPGDRLIMASGAAGEVRQRNKLARRMGRLSAAQVADKISKSADEGEEASVIVIDVKGARQAADNHDAGLAGLFHRDQGTHETHESHDDKDRNKKLGRLGLAGAGISAAALSYWATRKDRRRERDYERGGRRHVVSDVFAGAPLKEARHKRYVRDDGMVVRSDGSEIREDEYYRKRNNKGRKVVLGAALLLGTLAAWKLGENWITDAGDGKDLGIDLLPNWFSDDGPHDHQLNPLRGLDVNPFNETNTLNDDPINFVPVVNKDEGLDLLPAFFDGDNIDVWKGDAPASWDFLDDEEEVLRARDKVDPEDIGTVTNPPADIDPPNFPPVDPPDVGVPPVEAWVPDTFYVEPGHGLTHEIIQLSQEMPVRTLTPHESMHVYEAAQARFGHGMLELPNHAGRDLYDYNGELRISAPGQAHWANEGIENFIQDEIRRIAEATGDTAGLFEDDELEPAR